LLQGQKLTNFFQFFVRFNRFVAEIDKTFCRLPFKY
jgi:hypothetical protein